MPKKTAAQLQREINQALSRKKGTPRGGRVTSHARKTAEERESTSLKLKKGERLYRVCGVDDEDTDLMVCKDFIARSAKDARSLARVYDSHLIVRSVRARNSRTPLPMRMRFLKT